MKDKRLFDIDAVNSAIKKPTDLESQKVFKKEFKKLVHNIRVRAKYTPLHTMELATKITMQKLMLYILLHPQKTTFTNLQSVCNRYWLAEQSYVDNLLCLKK